MYGQPVGVSQAQINKLNEVLQRIGQLPANWHAVGTCGIETFLAIAQHAVQQPIRFSAETGTGASTAILSQISGHHTVFSRYHPRDEVPTAYAQGIFDESRLHFVLGPTQKTLPYHVFAEPLDFALIDGAHGYPYPEMDYYYFYQHLAPNALLIVDDIHIPTIRRLFEFLNEEKMFRLVDIKEEKTAFYRRTDYPTFDPEADQWHRQGYNVKHAPPSLQPFVERDH
jgi:hypothetical protein